jgi:hypothetical protein
MKPRSSKTSRTQAACHSAVLALLAANHRVRTVFFFARFLLDFPAQATE